MSRDAQEWWKRAVALERAGEIEKAEATIRDAVPHIAFAMITADLHAERMRRLQGAGDREGATRAFDDASRWINFYAGLATSGGEGAALSAERDRFLATLRADFHG